MGREKEKRGREYLQAPSQDQSGGVVLDDLDALVQFIDEMDEAFAIALDQNHDKNQTYNQKQ